MNNQDAARLATYQAILRCPVDATIAGRFGRRVTAAVGMSPSSRIAWLKDHTIRHLMIRDLLRDGDV